VATQVVDAMRDVVAHGTGTGAQQPAGVDVFGKTGTTDDFSDAWFTGCLPSYGVCITAWMGYRDSFLPDGSTHSMRGVEGVGEVFGGTLPANLFSVTAQGFRDRAAPVAPTTSAPAPSTSRYVPPPPTRRPAPSSSTPPSTSPRRTTATSAPATTSSAPPPVTVTPTPTQPSGSASSSGGPGLP
jgi:membrane peptidoglycan carboxypeptidase